LLVLSIACATVTQKTPNVPTFHLDAQRTGWNSVETVLTPVSVSSGKFGPLWNSPLLDSVKIGSNIYTPHLYATPLYIDDVLITRGDYANRNFSVIFAASSNGWVYAINAFSNNANGKPHVPAGTILWKTSLGPPVVVPFDGGVPLGILGTPVIDGMATRPRLYVASTVASKSSSDWEVFALDLGGGSIISGWPVTINDTALAPTNRNGRARFQNATAMSQRGALNLSPDGSVLYVPFGAYNDGGVGWMVSISTAVPRLLSAFSSAPSTVAIANGGMWGSGGLALDKSGKVYQTTGNSPADSGPALSVWGQSLVVWSAGSGPLDLLSSYTPFNYCQLDLSDTDLGGDSPVIIPDLDPARTATPYLLAFGSKQGNAYLVDRTNIRGGTSGRHPCSTDAASDRSLLPPNPQPQFGTRGPLNIFGPYSETGNHGDIAKARTTPAYFQGADGTPYLFFSGSSKTCATCKTVTPPSLIRLVIVTSAAQPAYLAVDAEDSVLRFLSPGSPVVTSNGSLNPIVWVVDANLYRSQPFIGPDVPHPVLYAVDGMTMNLLWNNTASQLDVGGKYNTPTIAHGTAFVGTDRIQAFGLTAN
jgi:hypothetical protein